MSKFGDGEGCGGCFFEVFGELAVYVFAALIGGGVLLAFGFLPGDFDLETAMLIGGCIIAVIFLAFGLPISYQGKQKQAQEQLYENTEIRWRNYGRSLLYWKLDHRRRFCRERAEKRVSPSA